MFKKFKSKVRKTLYNKYFVSKLEYDIFQIDRILTNENYHLVSQFKELLIYDEVSDFFVKFYRRKEARQRLIQLNEYYTASSLIFPNYTALDERKILYKNIIRKQKVIDLIEAMEDEEEKNKFKKKLKKEINDRVFETKIYESIAFEPDISKINALFNIQKSSNPLMNNNNYLNDDSFSELERFTYNLDKIVDNATNNYNTQKKRVILSKGLLSHHQETENNNSTNNNLSRNDRISHIMTEIEQKNVLLTDNHEKTKKKIWMGLNKSNFYSTDNTSLSNNSSKRKIKVPALKLQEKILIDTARLKKTEHTKANTNLTSISSLTQNKFFPNINICNTERNNRVKKNINEFLLTSRNFGMQLKQLNCFHSNFSPKIPVKNQNILVNKMPNETQKQNNTRNIKPIIKGKTYSNTIFDVKRTHPNHFSNEKNKSLKSNSKDNKKLHIPLNSQLVFSNIPKRGEMTERSKKKSKLVLKFLK